MGRRPHVPIRPRTKQTVPSKHSCSAQRVLLNNRGCFHAASVLAAFRIGSFWAEPTALNALMSFSSLVTVKGRLIGGHLQPYGMTVPDSWPCISLIDWALPF